MYKKLVWPYELFPGRLVHVNKGGKSSFIAIEIEINTRMGPFIFISKIKRVKECKFAFSICDSRSGRVHCKMLCRQDLSV